jgi:hypothetical protein
VDDRLGAPAERRRLVDLLTVSRPWLWPAAPAGICFPPP